MVQNIFVILNAIFALLTIFALMGVVIYGFVKTKKKAWLMIFLTYIIALIAWTAQFVVGFLFRYLPVADVMGYQTLFSVILNLVSTVITGFAYFLLIRADAKKPQG